MPDSFNLLGCLVGIAVLLAFAGLIIWMVRRERAKKDARRQLLAALGFVEVPNSDVEIFTRLEAMHRRSQTQRFVLRSLHEKTSGSGRFLIFDLVETSGDDNTYLGENAVAVLSPELNLPRGTILGRMSLEGQTAGWMVRMAEKVLDWAVRQSRLERLSLEDAPDLDGRLMVMAEDEAAFRACFTADRLRRLAWLGETERLSAIDCDGDLFILKRQTTPSHQDAEKDLSSLLRDAQQAWMALAYRETTFDRN